MTGVAVPVIVNCRAGSQAAEKMTEQLTAAFHRAGIELDLIIAGEGDDLAEVAKRVVAGRPAMIVAGGGDGTINAVASAAVGTGTVLGVLPLGTLNHFAKDLGIPLETGDAVRVLREGRTAALDVGEVNERVFINNSSLGLYPSLVRRREQQQMRLGRGKWTAVFWSALTLLRRYPLLRVHVKVDGADIVCRTPLVFIGNNAYKMEGLDIGIRERIDGGRLSLYIPRLEGRLGLVRIALRALFKRLRRADDFIFVEAEEFTVETHRKHVRVATDGEVAVMMTPLHYRIRPGVLKVCVPRGAP